MNEALTFIKLGGSLITDKTQPGTLRPDIIQAVCEEIGAFLSVNPGHKLIIGHGSGSFGHVPAKVFRTREGVSSPDGWKGFSEVWYQAARLNTVIRDHLKEQQIPVIGFSPSASVTTRSGSITSWDLTPIERSLQAGLTPLIYGDVVFDEQIGGTILSTEELFVYLARRLRPKRILLAGVEEGVWRDFPNRVMLFEHISPEDLDWLHPGLEGAEGHDVTGGMAEKVSSMGSLVGEIPELEVVIFSGLVRENIRNALGGRPTGTRISKDQDSVSASPNAS